MDKDYLSSISNDELFRLIKEKFGIEVKDENDIQGSWLVVEKLVEMGFYVDIGVDEHGAQVQLDRFDPSREIFWETGSSIRGKDAPEAICRAAWKAKENE